MKVRDKKTGQFKVDENRLKYKNCLECGDEYYCRSQFKYETSKYCSKKCLGKAQSKSRKGKAPYKMTDKIKKKISESKTGVSIWGGSREMPWMKGENNPKWKDEILYESLHDWVRYNKGKAKDCFVCGDDTGRNHWANLDHSYTRNLDKYCPMCPACHKMWDTGNLPINLMEAYSYYRMGNE